MVYSRGARRAGKGRESGNGGKTGEGFRRLYAVLKAKKNGGNISPAFKLKH